MRLGMNYKQVIFRLEALIKKDKECISGYKLALFNNQDKYKKGAYRGLITKYNNSIEKKKKAIQSINKSKQFRYNWEELCRKYKFRPYTGFKN